LSVTSPVTDELLVRLVASGWSYARIAEVFGYKTADVVRGMYHRAKRRLSDIKLDDNWVPVAPEGIPKYDDTPIIQAPVLVVSDIHFPTTNYHFLNLALAFGEKHMPDGQRRMLILGDMLNMDLMSDFAHITPPAALTQEFDIAEAFIKRVTKTFDEILYVQGNHEDRIRKKIPDIMYGHRFGRMIYDNFSGHGKIRVSMARRAEIVSRNRVWRATHQNAYSRGHGAVGMAMAQKYRSDIIVAHQHRVGIIRDLYNHYTVIDCGGLFDATRMAYVSRVDSTSPAMANGFVFVDTDGAGHLLTPYPSMTSWKMWGMENEYEKMIANSNAP
jgi:predicted phosphodiesterase